RSDVKTSKTKLTPNPSAMSEQAYGICVGFAGYTVNRLVSRIGYSQASARSARAGKHTAAAASVLGAIGAYLVAGRWERLRAHRESVLIGAGIAALQTLVQAYAPAKYAWLVCDYHEAASAKAMSKTPTSQSSSSAEVREGIDLE